MRKTFYHEKKGWIFLTISNEERGQKLVQYEEKFEAHSDSFDSQNQEMGELKVALKNISVIIFRINFCFIVFIVLMCKLIM